MLEQTPGIFSQRGVVTHLDRDQWAARISCQVVKHGFRPDQLKCIREM
jgi:hypothetical protein